MNTNPESKRFFQRSIICAVGVAVLFILLLFRLLYLQIIKHGFYATLSKRNVISVIPVEPNRGLIYDRNGVVLAKNIPVYSLMIIPGRVKELTETIKALTPIVNLTSDDIQNFYHMMKQYYPYQSVPLKQQLTEEEVDSFYVNQYRFPGVTVQANMIRNYPLGNALSNVVGYVGRITASELARVNPTNYTASNVIGKTGIESEDETLLHGTMGAEEAEIDATGKVVRVLKTTPATPGDNIYLTIDSKLQATAEKLLGSNAGAVVAIQPATGQVLALATNPSFDPNMFVTGLSNAQYNQIMNTPNHPLFNRAIRALYAPGSSIKPFIAFGALNDGVINTQDYIFDPGWFRIPHTKQIFHNWVKKGFGWVNVSKAIMVSCDTFFYELATVMGIDRLDQAVTQFGFGQLTGINLPDERDGVVPSPAWKMKHIGQPWYTGDTVNAGIGQGYMLVTPIQLASATATLAERGLRFQPTVLLKVQEPSGDTISMEPIAEQSIVAADPKAWQTVIQAMQSVISDPEGTAYPSFQKISYTAAGKTGTAQVASDSSSGTVSQKGQRFQNNHFFIVFVPVSNPQIAIAVVIEHVPNMTQRGVQIARALLDFYMTELKNNPSDSGNAAANSTTTPAVAIPAPQGNATKIPVNTAPKDILPPPSGLSLLPDATLKTITSKTPIPESPHHPTETVLPPPQGNKQIQEELGQDLQNEITNQDKQQNNSNHDQAVRQLQQQMDLKMDAQIDMQTQNTDQ